MTKPRTPVSGFSCLYAAAFVSLTPYSPDHALQQAKREISIADKISVLRDLTRDYPQDPHAETGRKDLVTLLADSNRLEEALAAYPTEGQTGKTSNVDFTLLDYQLKTGRYGDVLRETAPSQGPIRDFIRDEKLLEIRVQALLARGYYQVAGEGVDRWLSEYSGDGLPGSRFEGDVRSIQFLRRHLATLERVQGAKGKPIFTASAADSLQHWSHEQNVPIVFFKLIPAHPGGQLHEMLLPGRHETDDYFQARVDELNRGFAYISGGSFSLQWQSVSTLYVKEGDMDPASSGGHLLTSRVYVHTIPELYGLAGRAFVILVDYREQAADEAAYMGDGFIHISAAKLQTMVVMHEILHGLGATHQEWGALQGEGYRFDPEDRGLMTFENGELRYLGLEEKNRELLDWPQVAVIKVSDGSNAAASFREADVAPVGRLDKPLSRESLAAPYETEPIPNAPTENLKNNLPI